MKILLLLTMIIISLYYIRQEFNKLRSENVSPILAQADLARKDDSVNFVEKRDFEDKLKSLNKKLFQIKQNMYLLKMS